jgi:putative DNA primase/helicase
VAVSRISSNFLREYFDGTRGRLYLGAIRNSKSRLPPGEIDRVRMRNSDAIDKFVSKYDKPEHDCAIYFCTATLREGRTSRTAADCQEFTSLFADCDDHNHELKRERVIELLEALDCPPTVIVNSGHGLQPHWLLSEPSEDAARIVAAREKLHALVASDAVADPPRYMRLPGSHNSKGGDWLPVEIVSHHAERRYSLETLEEWLDTADVVIPRKAKPKANGADKPFIVPPSIGSGTDHKRGMAWARAALEASARELASAGEGSRHDTLRDKACRMGTMVARGWIDTLEVRRALFAAAEACGQIKEYGVPHFNETFAAGIKFGMTTPHADLPNDDATAEKPRPEKSNAANGALEDLVALDFAKQHADDFRYVAMWNRWMKWDGARWRPEGTLRAFDEARRLCREAGDAKAKTVNAVVTLARSDRNIAATGDQWDTHGKLLSTASTTIDLRTGVGRKPDPLDYITKIAAVAPAPSGTPHQIWTAFLERVTNCNAELVGFLQRYLGYCLTGDTHEHCFLFAHGTGANGKGTFINTIAKVFGDYATIAGMDTFMASNNERHPTEIAKLMGARLVIAQETQQGRKWDEVKIKALTGGDRQTARFMRQDFFDFDPKFKLFIVGNHKPNLNTVDEAMRRRLLLVPFTVQIPKSERDTDLPRKLKAEWPAILRWAIDGCLEWQRIGLAPPAIVREATESYFEAEDLITQWIEEKCDAEIGNEFKWDRIADLFASWSVYAKAAGDHAGSKKAFTQAMQAKGFERNQKGHNKDRVLTGIRLKPQPKSYNDRED